MTQQVMLAKEELTIWTWLVSRGISNSLKGLSEMVGKELVVSALDMEYMPVKDTINLLGGPEETVIGTYLSVRGDATGHLLLVHSPKEAFELIDGQLGRPLGSTQELGEMEQSVLGEVGNITGAFFLNALADATNMILSPSPPDVMVDMAGAILGVALARIMQQQDDILTAKVTFGSEAKDVEGTMLIMPTMDFIQAILGQMVK